ncbi:PAS domain-containing hybrid sensor histidine kinase/response regulator [Janthinobacterium sp. PC23-8]|uniref:PAS domain-containing hybrid sensor histidine kinase/response regulator n=1 Tax=Janthinobacterium sp. PC23-8 TaxID=2012679 RepID=UPI000B971DD6|nr:PAS domain-containing hybrid sensor histidine kinase/response regulator [Janthinobacterium sp. PC23-8]OYO31940.1 hybrid sensor histidine kinase/response regulator [Janthinobacterium sp. PC23-8]
MNDIYRAGAAARAAHPALLQADVLQEAIFSSPYFSCIATDAQGVIQLFNVGAERMLGYQADDVINRITPAGISDTAEAIVRAAALSQQFDTPISPGFEALVYKASRGIEDSYELTYVRKDGSRFPAIVSVTALRDGSQAIIGYLLIGTDNTVRKHAEQERELLNRVLSDNSVELENARAQADKANRAKSDFLSSMSHELRTPLNAVLGFAQLMASDTPPPSASQQRSLDQILNGGWYLLRLINEILDLSMIESGRVAMSREAMALTEVLRDCRAMITPQAQKRHITLSFPSLAQPFYVHADLTRVKQVVINLLSNAIKYNRTGGSVQVECRLHGDRVRLSVRDTGNGLSAEQLQQLFQPFNRLGQEAGTEEGTGIGLVVTKQLVELMGGTLGVESEVGVGTMFWIELAASSAPELQLGEHAADLDRTPSGDASCDAPRRKVLYVEDNPANLILVEQLIARRSDLDMLSAVDGHLGIALARQHQPDLILMDINLPGISGTEVLGLLRADPLTAHIPVIALSANALPRDVRRGLDAGFLRYLTKPINVPEFMEALDTALSLTAAP